MAVEAIVEEIRPPPTAGAVATLVDIRNIIDPDLAVRAGFRWIGLGRWSRQTVWLRRIAASVRPRITASWMSDQCCT